MGPGQWFGTGLFVVLALLAANALRVAGTGSKADAVDGAWIAEALRNRRME